MRSIAELEEAIAAVTPDPDPQLAAEELLKISEETIEHWIVARGETPTDDKREGFRLLGLHRQGAKGEPSFNACRETCREIAYHFNLITLQGGDSETTNRLEMMRMISNHLYLFISGKMQVAELGDFCCSSKPIRLSPAVDAQMTKEA